MCVANECDRRGLNAFRHVLDECVAEYVCRLIVRDFA